MNFQVFNALNLIKTGLGNAHEKRNFNPFGANFKLDVENVKKLLNMQAKKLDVATPAFLEAPSNQVLYTLRRARWRVGQLTKALEASAEITKNAHIFAQICQEMLKQISCKRLNFNEVLEVYKTIFALDENYAKILCKIFDKQFDLQIAINAFMQLCQTKTALQKRAPVRAQTQPSRVIKHEQEAKAPATPAATKVVEKRTADKSAEKTAVAKAAPPKPVKPRVAKPKPKEEEMQR